MHRLTRALRGAAAALLLGGCARMAPPPGGPPDRAPPTLLATFPESVAVLEGFDDWVVFTFDEVVDEGSQPNFGTGTGELERLVLLSPDTLVPRISWRRDKIAVRPREGWRPNTTYRIELAPGLRDLRGNQLREGQVITFATGGPLPTTVLRGRAVDWSGRRFVPAALVEAITPDSQVYRTLADSSGRFALGPLPAGEWLVRVTIDENRNRRRDGRDPWDTVRVAAGRDSVGEVWAFGRDTLPPRPNGATAAARVDSFSIAVTLTQPVDPTLELGASAVRVLALPDSVSIGAITALPAARHDSVYRAIDEARRAAATPPPDSAAADTAGAVRPAVPPRAAPSRPALGRGGATPADTSDVPREPRPPLGNRIVVRTTGPLRSGTRYRIEIDGVRAAGGAVGDILVVLQVPEAPKPTAADTAAKAGARDTVPPPATRPDSATAGQPRR